MEVDASPLVAGLARCCVVTRGVVQLARAAVGIVTLLVSLPVIILQKLTIPRVEQSAEEENEENGEEEEHILAAYSPALAAFSAAAAPCFIALVLLPDLMLTIAIPFNAAGTIGIPIGVCVAPIGLPLSLGLLIHTWWRGGRSDVRGKNALTSPPPPPPRGIFQILLLLVGFASAISWIYAIANELIGSVASLGLLLRVPDETMGLIVLALGNSLQDLAANATTALAGFPAIAVVGCLAAPIFNILIGLGVPLVVALIQDPGAALSLGEPTAALRLTFGASLLVIIFIAAVGVARGSRLTRFDGVGLLVFWLLAIVATIICELVERV